MSKIVKVKRDKWGLYVEVGGYFSRPLNINTRYSEGDEVKVHHFGGSTDVGVGKDSTCGHGKYLETWCTAGMHFLRQQESDDQIAATLEFYRLFPNPKIHISKKTQEYYDKQREYTLNHPRFKELIDRMHPKEKE